MDGWDDGWITKNSTEQIIVLVLYLSLEMLDYTVSCWPETSETVNREGRFASGLFHVGTRPRAKSSLFRCCTTFYILLTDADATEPCMHRRARQAQNKQDWTQEEPGFKPATFNVFFI